MELVPLVDLLWMLGGGLIWLMLARVLGSESWAQIANPMATIWLAVCLGAATWRLLKAHRRYLFLPITGFLIASGVYFGIGSLLVTFGSAAEIGTAKIIVDFSTLDVTRVLILNQVAILAVVASYLGWNIFLGPAQKSWGGGWASDSDRQIGNSALLILMVGLGIWGLAVRSLVALPFDMKLTDKPPSGLLVGTAAFSYGTGFYLWFRARSGKGKVGWPLVFTGSDFLIGIVALSKTAMLLPWLMAILGSHAARPLRSKTWVLLSVFGIGLLALIQPVNNALRNQRKIANPQTMTQAVSIFGEAANLQAIEAFQDMRKASTAQDTLWLRISYLNVEAFVLRQRDRGKAGDSYKYFMSMLVPRWLWPDKPVANPGHDFDRDWLGADTAAIGLTLFGEAFFNLGWPGIILLSVLLAGIFRAYELPVRWVLKEGRFEQAITLFSGIFIGVRVDDFAIMIVSTFLAAIPFALIIFAARRICEGLLSESSSSSRT